MCPLDLYLGTNVPELLEIPTSIEFLRDYVAKNMPVVIREGIFLAKKFVLFRVKWDRITDLEIDHSAMT